MHDQNKARKANGRALPGMLQKSYMGRLFAVAKTRTAIPGVDRKYQEVLLAAGDFCLFLMAALMIVSLLDVLSPGNNIHRDTLVLFNFSLFNIFAAGCRYFDLTDGRYSLGKGLLITTTLWLANCLVLIPMGIFSVPLFVFTAVVLTGAGIVSGYAHYKLSYNYSTNNPESMYFALERAIKRGFDIIACLLGLIMVSPLLALTAILISMESKGSPLFGQVRVGQGEQLFKMWKFRSMIKDAGNFVAGTESEPMLYKKKNDPRITRVGHIIRKLSIDELPQLWNVVCGEMSLVGPRPPLSEEHERMNRHHKRKFAVQPGITGFWQITGRVKDHRDFNSVAMYDGLYIETWCLMEDLKILLKTIPVVLFQKGAY